MGSEYFDESSKIWVGKKQEPMYNVNISVGNLILNVLKNTPERITQVSADTNVEITCHEMRLRTIKISKHLINAGFKQGDVVGMMATNSENLAPVVFACLTLGLPINFLAPVMTESDVGYMFGLTKPKVIICDANLVNVIGNFTDKLERAVFIMTLREKVEGVEFLDDVLASSDDNVENFVFPDLKDVSTSTAIILCSSGTTALPKGVCKSHSQIIWHIFPMWSIKSKDQEVLFNFSTLYWATGFNFLIIGTLYGAKRVITTKAFSPEVMIDIIDRFKVTTTLVPPSSIASLIQSSLLKPLESLEHLIGSGSVVSKSLCEAIQPFIPNGAIRTGYGTTEGDFIAVSFESTRFGSVGKPSTNVDIKIIDDDGNNLGPNQEGEICFRTPVLFSGYFGDPQKTKESVLNNWVFSGDIGYFDDDGFLFIVDRKKDMLKFNNFQVYPSELEEIINGIDGVSNSCVFGIFEEDKGNDLIFAIVVKDPRKPYLKEQEILSFVNSKVIDAKKLRGGVHFIEQLPMTPSGKIKRKDAREIAKNIFNSI